MTKPASCSAASACPSARRKKCHHGIHGKHGKKRRKKEKVKEPGAGRGGRISLFDLIFFLFFPCFPCIPWFVERTHGHRSEIREVQETDGEAGGQQEAQCHRQDAAARADPHPPALQAVR